MFCPHCGKQISNNAVICVHCGCPVNNGSNPAAKNKWISLLLCFFLGCLGAHKFYEGKILLGILYILTVGLFGIGVIVDFFVLLFKPNPYFP